LTTTRPPDGNDLNGSTQGDSGNRNSRRGRSRRSRGNGSRKSREFPDVEAELSEEEYCGEGEEANGDRMNVSDLKAKSVIELTEIAEELAVGNAGGMRTQDLLYAILKAQTEKRGKVYAEGVLETLPDGFGFLRAPDQNYLAGPDDIYVSPSQIRR